LIANALERGVTDRRPWYEPGDKMPEKPIINAPMHAEFDTVVVEMPPGRNAGAADS